MKRTTVIELIAALLILLFLYAAFSKLLAFRTFVAELSEHPLFKHRAVIMAIAIPLVEIFTAFCLFMPATRIWGLWGSLVLMSIFTLYIGAMLAFDSHLPCSCGGVLQQLTWEEHFIFNIGFTLLALGGVLLQRGISKPRAVFGYKNY